MPARTVAAILALGVLTAAPAADASDFYKGKTVTIIVGFSPGGGADMFGRLLGRHLGAHLPGSPSVIVQNMPGAGGLKSLNHIYNAKPQDGTRTILTSPSHTLAQVLDTPNVRYDMRRMKWLGTLTRDTTGCVASGRSGVKSIVEAADREIVVGATGLNDTIAQHSRLLASLLGYKLKVISGYQGTSQVRLAMETGEVAAVCSFWASQGLGPRKADLESGKLVPIVQMGSKPHPVFGDAPVAYDLARNDEERRVMRVIFGTTELSRPFLAPPDVPAERVATLRKAFWAAVTSPELKADAERLKLIVDPVGWEESEAAFGEIVNASEETVARAKKAIGAAKK